MHWQLPSCAARASLIDMVTQTDPLCTLHSVILGRLAISAALYLHGEQPTSMYQPHRLCWVLPVNSSYTSTNYASARRMRAAPFCKEIPPDRVEILIAKNQSPLKRSKKVGPGEDIIERVTKASGAPLAASCCIAFPNSTDLR